MLAKSDISLIRSLGDKRVRDERGLFVVEGRKMVLEALESPSGVERLFVAARAQGDVEESCRAAGLSDGQITVVNDKEMERISLLKSPSGMLALTPLARPALPRTEDGNLILVLDDVQDPGNVGTIVRLADWFGIGDVVCSPATADCYAPKVVQATMGAIFRVRVHYTPLAGFLQGCKVPIFGTFARGENIYQAQLPPGGIVVMGNEGRGISAGVETLLTRRLAIPPFPASRRGSESLNVAIATAVVCSEFRRRR
ncbi:tRNA/rRNA methyltransferase [Bacteroidia bacterium]|nr:tRNA/rRNA methyltransferase [Bacteroidia bacterium]